ncbi:MAG: 3',5'-cyclic-AMP phosphodiesterase [Elainellaceae cyanobacterium]
MTHHSPLRVAQITDTHLFADTEEALRGCQTAQTLQAVIQSLQQRSPDPDFILLTGDLSQDETPASYQQLRHLFHACRVPIYWIPGNHDDFRVMHDILNASPWISDKSFMQGGWKFVLLDSTVRGCTHGELSSQSLEWLDQQLNDARPHPTMVVLHHPPLPVGSAWIDELGLHHPQAFQEILDRHPQVKVVLFGHIHQAFDIHHRGIRYLATPSSCVQFKPNSSEFAVDTASPGFRVLSLYPDGHIETQVERVSESCLSQPMR